MTRWPIVTFIGLSLGSITVATAGTSTFPDLPDLTFLDNNGYVDTSKVITVYSQLPQFCEPLTGMVKSTCLQSCKDIDKKLALAVEEFSEDPTKLSAVRTALYPFGCASFFTNFSAKSKHFVAIKEYMDNVRKASLEQSPVHSTNTPTNSTNTPTNIVELYSSLRATDTPKHFTFKQAQEAIKSLAEFKRLTHSVESNPVDINTLRQQISELRRQKTSYTQNNKALLWREMIYKVAVAGAEKELFNALTQECNLDYLKQFKTQIPWLGYQKLPAKFVYGQGTATVAGQLQFHLSAPYFHRLCVEKLTPQLIAQVTNIQDPKEAEQIASEFYSGAPVISDSTLFNRPPLRQMSEQEWVPAWSTYIETLRQQHYENTQLALAQKQAEEKQKRLIKYQEEREQRLVDKSNQSPQDKSLENVNNQRITRNNANRSNQNQERSEQTNDLASIANNEQLKQLWLSTGLVDEQQYQDFMDDEIDRLDTILQSVEEFTETHRDAFMAAYNFDRALPAITDDIPLMLERVEMKEAIKAIYRGNYHLVDQYLGALSSVESALHFMEAFSFQCADELPDNKKQYIEFRCNEITKNLNSLGQEIGNYCSDYDNVETGIFATPEYLETYTQAKASTAQNVMFEIFKEPSAIPRDGLSGHWVGSMLNQLKGSISFDDFVFVLQQNGCTHPDVDLLQNRLIKMMELQSP